MEPGTNTIIRFANVLIYVPFSKEPDTVRLGDTNLADVADDITAQQISIRSFRKHPEYRPSRKYFDIALIELEAEAKFNYATCPACIWLDKDTPLEPMQAIGFGATGFGESLSPTLQKATLSLIDKNNCSETLPVSNRQQPNGFVDEQFCAGNDHMDTCEVCNDRSDNITWVAIYECKNGNFRKESLQLIT